MTKSSVRSTVLRYPGSAIRVNGPSEDVAWLTQFLGPSFSSRRTGESDWSVTMTRHQNAFDRRWRAGPDAGRRKRVCFHLDTATETLPVWRGPRGALTVFDRAHEVFATVRPDRGEVELLAPEDAPNARLALMRIVRACAQSRVTTLNGLLLHASAFVIDDKAALVIGAKRAGKSSLLLHALSQDATTGSRGEGPVNYLANDRVWLSLERHTPIARGFPTIASLRISGLALFPDVAERLRQSSFAPALSLRECSLSSAAPAKPWNRSTYTLSARQLCRLTGVDAIASAPTGIVLFPRVTRKPGRIRMIRMGPAEAVVALRAGLFRAEVADKSGGPFAAPGYPRRLDTLATHRRLVQLAETTPCYAVELGRDAYADRSWIKRLRAKMATGPD